MKTEYTYNFSMIQNATAAEAEEWLLMDLPEYDDAIIVRNEATGQFAVYFSDEAGFLCAMRYIRRHKEDYRVNILHTVCFAKKSDVAHGLVLCGCLNDDGSAVSTDA